MLRRITTTVLLGACLAGCHGPGKERAKAAPEPKHELEVKEEFFPGGRLADRIEGYVDEEGEFVFHGEHATWYDTGQKRMEMHYVDGFAHGPRLTWYETGQIWARGAYKNGREDGTWTAWYASGFRHREWHMIEGSWQGMYTEFHVNGEKRFEAEYISGKKQGPAYWWDEAGNELRRLEYLDDVSQP